MPTINSLAVPPELLPLYHLINSTDGTKEDVFDKVCKMFPGITKDDLVGKSRVRAVSRPRQLAMFVLYNYGQDLNLEAIGRLFGNRDHTTVLYAVTRIKQELGRIGVDRSLFQRSSGEIAAQSTSNDIIGEDPLITNCRDFMYGLGKICTFTSASEAIRYWDTMKRDYGRGIKEGPAIDLDSRTSMPSNLAMGFYFHAQAIFASVEERRRDAPLLGTQKSLNLEEALRMANM